MAKPKLTDLSKEELTKKEKGLKTMIGIFIPIIVALFYSVTRDYMNGEDLNWPILTIAICSLAGPLTYYSELKAVREELLARG
ncbi:MAG: hypothetical protein ACE362_20045 [Phaeodactylibacter xiamenensis]|uniref:Uncharacterized protein n=1 Tax=Phaeodactylibacter xiamenensis TaxID=1524460 RepID=A0A098S0M6_9BACT|nr:hypothetical protein [Phaeodactylibacter xiamenensis]KGE85894.1 hypothetical protein IX84_25130 [Phaeodactylibacter xiamenensis]MCR9051246.1 hypothetical protein [bacterium]